MSALNRIKKDNEGNMMMPQNVAGSTYEEGASVTQAVVACALLLFIIITILWFKDTRAAQKIINWVFMISFLLFITQLVVRYIIINEPYLMNQTNLLLNAENKVPADLWGVINIDDDGVIYYQDGRIGVIISAEQATVVGRKAQFKDVHYSNISEFYKVLNQNGISWTHFNAMISAKSENRLNVLTEELNKCKNANIKKMCDMHLAHLRNIEIRTLYEREYWALIVRPSVGKDKLLEIVYQATDNLEVAAFNKTSILTKEQCYELNPELQGLSSFDANALMIEKAQKVAGSPIAKLIQVKIDTGHITDSNIKTIKESLKIYNDNSSYIETVKHISTFRIGEKFGNTIIQKLQYFIREKHRLNEGELLSNCMSIKIINNLKQDFKELDNQEINEPVKLFAQAGLSAQTIDELKVEQEEQLKQVTELNHKIYSIEEEAALKARDAKQTTLLEQKIAAQTKLAEQLAAKKAAQEEAERQQKAKVNFEEFNSD